MTITKDAILNEVETESGLRGLLESIVGALRFRATANNRDAQVAQANGNKVEAVRESHVADARIRNAELIGFVIDNMHSFEPPAVAAAAVAASASVEAAVPVESNDTSETETGEAATG
jgi:hypothetical protein